MGTSSTLSSNLNTNPIQNLVILDTNRANKCIELTGTNPSITFLFKAQIYIKAATILPLYSYLGNQGIAAYTAIQSIMKEVAVTGSNVVSQEFQFGKFTDYRTY